jgi:hypothetical protein
MWQRKRRDWGGSVVKTISLVITHFPFLLLFQEYHWQERGGMPFSLSYFPLYLTIDFEQKLVVLGISIRYWVWDVKWGWERK